MTMVNPPSYPSPPPTALSSLTLPSIHHPMSRMSDSSSLSIRGESRHVMSAHLLPSLSISENNDIPPCSSRQTVVSDMMTYVPHEGKFTRSVSAVLQQSTDFFESLIEEKVMRSFHGLKCMFTANDPTGQQVISREAFLRILFAMVGYIPQDKVTELMRRFDLDGKSHISFDEFISCFKYNEDVNPQWIQTVKQMTPREPDRKSHHREILDSQPHARYISMPYCQYLLCQKVQQRSFDFHDYLPQSCLIKNGRLISQHLQSFVEKLGILMTEKEHAKLWQRYDKKAVGTISIVQFYKMLGLDEEGRFVQPPVDKISNYDEKQSPCDEYPPIEEEEEEEEVDEKEENGVAFNDDCEVVKSSKRKVIAKCRQPVVLDKIVDQLHYKFEEAYRAMLQGLRCFDLLGDGNVARIDLKKVLDEFGFHVAILDLESLMLRFGLRSKQGQVKYEDLMLRLWGTLNKANLLNMELPTHRFTSSTERLSVEELERKLIEFLHYECLLLMGHFKRLDTCNLGLLPSHQFKAAIEQSLSQPMSDKQWQELKDASPKDSDGLVLYTTFIQTLLSHNPGEWNKREQNGFHVKKVINIPTPAIVLRLRDKARNMPAPVAEEKPTEGEKTEDNAHEKRMMTQDSDRPLQKLYEVLRGVFINQFNILSKAFKDVDRRMTSRFSKTQFADILVKCDVHLTSGELEKLWTSFDTSADNMFHFSKLVSKFSPCPEIIFGEKTDVKAIAPSSPAPINQQYEKRNILRQIKRDVVTHWKRLKMMLKQLDAKKRAVVTGVQMKDIFTVLKFQLTEDEANFLLHVYDLRKDNSFHYIEFLKNFAKRKKQTISQKDDLKTSLVSGSDEQIHSGENITEDKVLSSTQDTISMTH